MKDNILAVKALNQYRKRDVIPYIGLRYYLDNICSSRSRWIEDISCRLSTIQDKAPYHKVYHFKEIKDNGEFVHRDMYLPSPNEALAETALLTELSKHTSFKPLPSVYSYRFTDHKDKIGVFIPYFEGYKERHETIVNECMGINNSNVLYTDIKKFYPSICANDALKIWRKYSTKAKLSKKYLRLGEKLLRNHNEISQRDQSGKGILTGPIFSHVIANLLLKEVDLEMDRITEGKYWRYVDDIVLVGDNHETKSWRDHLNDLLSKLNLELHTGKKDFEVSTDEWLKGKSDFDNSFGIEWISLVADTRRFLLANPNKINSLKQAFLENQIRLPLIDYSQTINESSYLQRFKNWIISYHWSLSAVLQIDIDYLLEAAENCKFSLKKKLDILLQEPIPDSPYERKRLIPKLRYLTGRLAYLLENEHLIEVSDKLEKYPELCLMAKTMNCVATRDVSEIVQMGANATQAAAQILRLFQEPIKIHIEEGKKINRDVIDQSLAILSLNGIKYEYQSEPSELRQFSSGCNISQLMNSDDKFIQELACLHGISDSRHSSILDTAFDRDEELALDVIDQLQNSSYFN